MQVWVVVVVAVVVVVVVVLTAIRGAASSSASSLYLLVKVKLSHQNPKTECSTKVKYSDQNRSFLSPEATVA